MRGYDHSAGLPGVDLLDFDFAFIVATALFLVSLLIVIAMPETLKKASPHAPA